MKWPGIKKIIKTSVIILFLFTLCVDASQFVKNTLEKIDAVEGKVKLSLVRVWGDDDVDDENQFFRMPVDIEISNEGLVYILDSGSHRIQIFDREANFKRTVGRRGKGPGDLLSPRALTLDNNNNILVADSGNSRIQAFDSKGNYLYSFKTLNGRPSGIEITPHDAIAVYSYSDSFKSRKLISICSTQGKIIKKIGNHIDRPKSYADFESLFFTLDKDGSLFVTFFATPIYQKYSFDGKPLLTVNYEMPFKVPDVKLNPLDGEIVVKGEKKEKVSAGISVDKNGLVYLVITTRPIKENEKYFMVSDGPGQTRIIRKKKNTDYITDRFRLLVFNRAGKVIAARRLTVFCDNIYVHENHLFIIDAYMGMRIYEYRINFD